MAEFKIAKTSQMSIKAMMSTVPSQPNGTDIETAIPPKKTSAKGKAKALEDIYQKKTQLEHILLRPDTYIGSVESCTESMWVYDKETEKVVQREVTYVPGLYKIFDEILVNAADHKQRDEKMDTIKIDINQEDNVISIWNNGKGIPIATHAKENMFVPTMIFGHLLTSSNYDDEEEKVTGGRNGFGAKLCNIFSTKFVVETLCKEYKKSFKQAWANNMSKTTDPKIKEMSSGSDFTKITFSPDLTKFKMTSLDDDIVSIMSKRAYDVAASSRGVKVYLNGKRVPVKTFKEYVELILKDKTDEDGNQIKCIYENVNPRWEVAVALSDKGFQQISFVNSIATSKGGRHIEYVTDMVVKGLVETLKKKNKSGVTIKPFQPKSFGSKCSLSDKFMTSASKSGIVEAVMMWAKFKQQAQLQSKCAAKKHNKIKGIPKLEDANDAGTRFSSDCTLILTEGDSAKTLAVAGLGVVGRDRYGVFPLKGKLLNVREASHKQILENAEINSIIKILGLQYKKKYDANDDIKTLRYGKLMIMTDQDQDGSHIKGLLINFIHHNWPTLLRQPFLEEFITPIVKALKGKEELPFYSLPEFEEWKAGKDNWHTYKIKYYKGLGTSTSKEAKEYFHDMKRHRILFRHAGTQDDHSINMAFSKKAVDQRKEWLTSWMEECKRRKELGLPDIYLYEKDTRSINYSDFVNKELVLFSNLDNERSIPSLVDGLKPGQRKVLFTCLKRNDKKEIKVAQLAGSVGEHSAYHHGEASLMSTIINLAQNFVGSNNINLLKPIGQFGTRLQGGKDAASPRYIFTQLSSVTRFLFHINDEPILNYLRDDNLKIEPEWYIPIIPMVLVNGAEGIGTGWSTKIPNYNPRDIVKNIKRLIRGEDMLPMNPWFKNFRGAIDELDHQRFVAAGEIGKLAHNKYEIIELPVRTWTQHYKETVMEVLLQGTEKNPALISDYREYHTDTTVRFVVSLPEDKVDRIDEEGPHKVFKLQTTFSLSSMVLFDHNGCLKKYENVCEILQEFYDLRLRYYGKRKAYLVGMLEAEANKLSNQARFILEKCDGRLVVENKKRKEMIAELQRKGYDSDPVKIWKRAFDKNALLDEEQEKEEDIPEGADEKSDYDYLLGMAMWNLTKEKKDELIKKKDDKVHELESLKRKSPSNLWEDDLNAFLEELDKVEQKEKEDDEGVKKGSAFKALGGAKRKKFPEEALPSPFAERILPRIDPELRKKAEKAAQAKENKGKKGKKDAFLENDEFDDLVNTSVGKSLVARLGTSPDQIEKQAKKSKMKQTKLNFKPKKLTQDTSDEDEIRGSSDEDGFSSPAVQVEPRERAAGRRAAAAKVKYQFSDDEESEKSEGDMSLHSNEGVQEEDAPQHMSFNDSSVVEPVKKADANHAVDEIDVSDTDSEFENQPKKAKTIPAKPVPKPTASQMFDSLLSLSPNNKDANNKADSKPNKKISVSSSDSDSDTGPSFASRIVANLKSKKEPKEKPEKPKPRAKAAAKAPTKAKPRKRKASSDSDSDIFATEVKKPTKTKMDEEEEYVPRLATGRTKRAVKYNFGDSDTDEDM